jgi:purine-binding chemotaxis protein CheW
MNQRRQLCTFFLQDLFFGVEVEKVQEVIRYQEMTRIPLAPEVIAGLINLRGQIVTAIDLRRQLALAARKAGQLPMNVVIRRDDGPISLLVDEIGDVVEVDEDSFEGPPDTLDNG